MENNSNGSDAENPTEQLDVKQSNVRVFGERSAREKTEKVSALREEKKEKSGSMNV
jgi:hypothetical protein